MRIIIKRNWFITALFLSPFIAWLWPELGFQGSVLQTDILLKIGIASIFFFSGLSLRRKTVFRTIGKIKLHFFIQSYCFIFFPLLVVTLLPFIKEWIHLNHYFSIGIIILSCMPTTISSCVVMTSLSKGDEAGALFNGILSNLMGIFLCPFLLSAAMHLGDQSLIINPFSILKSLMLTVLLPLLVGNTVHFYFKENVNKSSVSKKIRYANSFIVLFIIYVVFCDTFFSLKAVKSPSKQLSILVAGLILLHLTVLILSFLGARWMRFPIKEQKAIIFTAPQKTLAMGMPLTMAIIEGTVFANNHSDAILMTLPLAIYHHVELLIAAIILQFNKSWPKESNHYKSP